MDRREHAKRLGHHLPAGQELKQKRAHVVLPLLTLAGNCRFSAYCITQRIPIRDMSRTAGVVMSSRLTLSLAAMPLFALVVAAQAPSAPDKTAALKESLAQNQAALRQYSWIETTQISLKGEVKKQEQKQCYYGADGKVQKTPIGEAPAAKSQPASGGGGRGGRGGGRLKENIVENKIEDMKEYVEKVGALVKDYVPPDAQKIQAAAAAGNVSKPTGDQPLTVKNYLKQGDQLSIGFDVAAKKLTSYNVNSYVEKPKDDDVTLAVTFARLPDGTSYPQQVLLDAKAKKLQVKITNSGYKKGGA
jgi:hypothetical protein